MTVARCSFEPKYRARVLSIVIFRYNEIVYDNGMVQTRIFSLLNVVSGFLIFFCDDKLCWLLALYKVKLCW